MSFHTENRVIPYTQQQIFELVADVEKYPEFLPWCLACRKTRILDDGFEADLAIGFKMVREQFSSRIILHCPNQIEVSELGGPFRKLSNLWQFKPTDQGNGTEVKFSLEFEFRSRILQKMIGILFEQAVHKMVAAFEARAHSLYGVSGEL